MKNAFFRRKAYIAAAFALLATVVPAWNGAAQNQKEDIEKTTVVKQGAEAPDFTVEMLDGSKVTLSELRGKVVLVNFWATWCPPCREELKHVQKDIIDRFEGEEFVFLPISRGEKAKVVEAFRSKAGYTFPMGLDPDQSIFKLYAENYIPRNFLVDKQGNVILTSVGYSEEEFAHMIDTIAKALE